MPQEEKELNIGDFTKQPEQGVIQPTGEIRDIREQKPISAREPLLLTSERARKKLRENLNLLKKIEEERKTAEETRRQRIEIEKKAIKPELPENAFTTEEAAEVGFEGLDFDSTTGVFVPKLASGRQGMVLNDNRAIERELSEIQAKFDDLGISSLSDFIGFASNLQKLFASRANLLKDLNRFNF